MNKKKALLFGGIILITVISFVVFNPFSKNSDSTQNPELEKYVTEYTSGVIPKDASIIVRLTSNAIDNLKENYDINNLFEFSPNIEGSTNWIDTYTLEFKPNKNLNSNEEYEVVFNLDKLITNAPSDLDEFVFSFKTIKQSFEVTIDQQITIDKKALKWQKVIGFIQTADIESLEKIKKIINASQNEKALKIKWRDTNGAKMFYFEIDSIRRFDKSSIVNLEWNGEAINVENTGNTEINIPAYSDFSFISAKVINSPEQFVQLQFSDPLRENQDLRGLIKIKNVYNIKFEVENNIIKVFPSSKLIGVYDLTIYEGVQNIIRSRFKKTHTEKITFEEIKPSVRFVNKGVILPNSDKGLILPFEAVNIKAIDVRITKIYNNNVLQFLQTNELDGNYDLHRVGKTIVEKTVRLDQFNVVDFGKWNRYVIDLNELITVDPGAIYRVSLNFKETYSTYLCDDENTEDNNISESDNWDYFDDYYYGEYDDYDYWDHRDNPCYKAYYGKKRKITQNILASDLGIIVKKGKDNTITAFVSDILTTKPINNVNIEIYDYQQQLIKSSTTDNNGIAKFVDVEDVYFLIAKHNSQFGYAKLNDGNSLSLSMFDVSGVSLTKGLKGYIYGERGVWRPGDSLFVTFMLQENNKPLPLDHPIIMTLFNTDYQKVKRIVKKKNANNIYTFKFKTNPDDKTGNWLTKVDVGGTIFSKTLKIETIKPNRLKIKLDFGKKEIKESEETHATLHTEWLHGAMGKNLKAKVDVKLYSIKTSFDKFKEYNFDDPSKGFYPETNTIFNGKSDENGNADFIADLSIGNIAPGKLNAVVTTKVFEPGGNFSINSMSIPYSPYKFYTGIKIRSSQGNKMLVTDTNQYADVVIVDDNGKLTSQNHRMQMEIYKLEWRWWWENQDDYLSNYIGRSYIHPIKKEIVNSSNGKLSWKFRVNYPDWGRYLIRATDLTTGHSTAKIAYLDWPDWYSRENTDHSQGATMLSFTTDKDKYEVDDEIIVTIPTSGTGRALISIENGTKVISTEWIKTEEKETVYRLKATKEMAPNAYINVSLIQPHSQTINDLPIRLYGIVPIMVEDAETHITPVISMPDKIEAEKDVTIKIEEKDGNDMSFTVAVVDEGLLDITNYTTPDPWIHFYAKEALGVVSWDIYDYVIGAYGGKLDRLLNIGGGGPGGGEKGNKKANRFKPVVKFFGPFYLKGGNEKVIKFKMPKYIGSVKTMVVAKHKKAYGSASKVSKVIKPLMILGTLPRTLSPGETVQLPVSVFAMEKNIKNVNVSIKPNGLFTIIGKSSQKVSFSKPDEKTIFFELKVKSKIGIGKVDIIASSGSKKSTYNIELDVKNPNTETTDVISKIVEAGKTIDVNYKPIGIIGTNKVTLEVSSIPPMNLGKRIKYLIKYPHGCVEQTTSGAFPQLYLENITLLTEKQKADVEINVKYAIERLLTFQLSNGGLGYWPSSTNVSEWGTNYAGHFLVEAKKKGYIVSNSFIKKWKKYQKNKASNWTNDGPSSQFVQAYRLYTLALEGSPDISSMNRLKSIKTLSQNAKWRLAAAYALAGKTKTANKIITGLSKYPVSNYNEYYYTYGSQTRDKAMILETLDLLKKRTESYEILKSVAEDLSSNSWMSTQTIAYSLISISKYVNKNITVDDFKFNYSFNNGKIAKATSKKPIVQITVPAKSISESSINIKNTSGGVLFVRLILTGIPEIGTETDASNNLNLSVIYQTLDGKFLNIENIEQGTDFKAIVTVKNPNKKTYSNIALSQVFPSGWEIINSRLFDANESYKVDKPEYQDIRDDRIYSYFNLYGLRSKTFTVHLNASYKGKYYMPAVNCELMYDGTINARTKGMWVNVVGN